MQETYEVRKQRRLTSTASHDDLEFVHKHREGNHEPFRSDVCWGNNHRRGMNVGVGMALPRPRSQRRIGHDLRRHTWKERSQFHCAGAYTAAVGLVAQSRGAGRTRIFLKSRRQRAPLAGGHSAQPPTGPWLCCCWLGSWLPPCHLKLIISFALHHARRAGTFVRRARTLRKPGRQERRLAVS